MRNKIWTGVALAALLLGAAIWLIIQNPFQVNGDAGANRPARFVTGPILGAVGADTITIKATSDLAAQGIVEYWAANDVTTTQTLATATAQRLTLTGLKPGTEYQYRFGLTNAFGTTWSSVGRWKTDGGAGQSFRFAVWADSRPVEGSTQPTEFKQLLARLAERKPFELGFAIGDNVQLLEETPNYDPQSTSTTWWKSAVQLVRDLGFSVSRPKDDSTVRDRYVGYFDAIGAFVRETPFYPALGNHDKPECANCLVAFRGYFALPEQNDQTYYSFNYGAAHFVVLNTRQDHGATVRLISDAQWQWLTADLAANRQPLTFVFGHDEMMHIPPSAEEPPFSPVEQERLHQLFLKGRVTAVFNGDAHLYDYYERDGVAYFITGGAGSPLVPSPYRAEWSQYEMLVVSVTPTQAVIEAIKLDGSVLDKRTVPIKR